MRKDRFCSFLFLATTLCFVVVILVTNYGVVSLSSTHQHNDIINKRRIKIVNNDINNDTIVVEYDSYSKNTVNDITVKNEDEISSNISSTLSTYFFPFSSSNSNKRISTNNKKEQQQQQFPKTNQTFSTKQRQRFIFHTIEFLPNIYNDKKISESSSLLLNHNEAEIIIIDHLNNKPIHDIINEDEEQLLQQSLHYHQQFVVIDHDAIDHKKNKNRILHSNITADSDQKQSIGMKNNDTSWRRKIAFRVLYEARNTQEDLEGDLTDTGFQAIAVSFEDIYKTIIFLGACWGCGMISVYVFGLTGLVGEIICGMLLGPPLLNVVPFPEAMVLVGNIGLFGLMLETGMSIDIANLKEVGARAFVIGTAGTFLPLIAGGIMGKYVWNLSVGESIAFGAMFSPTSFGVAGTALASHDYLNTPIGGMIVAASVVDDVWGLSLLSVLEVLVNDNSTISDYMKPFLSSFGFLIVLGYPSAITWLPWLINTKILCHIHDSENRNMIACSLMFILMLVYMPLLDHMKASYLAGIFLTGLSFSQIHSVPATFSEIGSPAMNWLLRVFFAATVGIQVPVRLFSNDNVLKHGLSLLLPVLMKVPLAFLVPTFGRDTPKDFPYNAHRRDMIMTALALTCRCEFNFIIGSFGLQYGLIEPNLYAAAVIAMLAISIVAPFGLSISLRYYNAKSREYLVEPHLDARIGDTSDGCRPLFLSIQARTPIYWGLQEKFKKVLEENGLIIIDHRSWHTMSDDRDDFNHLWSNEFGKDAIDITEIFVQDTKMKLKVKGAYSIYFGQPTDSLTGGNGHYENLTKDTTPLVNNPMHGMKDDDINAEEGVKENEQIKDRCSEVRDLLFGSIKSGSDPVNAAIHVKQWKAFQFGGEKGTTYGSVPNTIKSSLLSIPEIDDGNSMIGDSVSKCPQSAEFHNFSIMNQPSSADLWDFDDKARENARTGYICVPDVLGNGGHKIIPSLESSIGCVNSIMRNYPKMNHDSKRSNAETLSLIHSNRNKNNLDSIVAAGEMESNLVKARLRGYVRGGGGGGVGN